MTVVALVVNGVLRIVIIVVAGFSIWQFSDGFLLAWETLADPTKARWFNVLSALGEGLLGPVLALAAITLSATTPVSRGNSGDLGGCYIRRAIRRIFHRNHDLWILKPTAAHWQKM
jgi:hypothetical protein